MPMGVSSPDYTIPAGHAFTDIRKVQLLEDGKVIS